MKFQEGQIVEGFELKAFKGKGATAEVWEASRDNESCALKIFAPEFHLDELSKSLINKEYRKTEHLKHNNIVVPLDYFEQAGVPILRMELANQSVWDMYLDRSGSDGKALLNVKHQNDLFSEDELLTIIKDVALALQYLESNGIVHDDIKPANIMEKIGDGDSRVFALADFGISRDLRETIMRQTTGMNTAFSFAYASPEKHAKHHFSTEGDIFSLGASIIDLTNRIVKSPGILINSGVKIPEVNGNYSAEFKSLISSMMGKEPNDRIGLTEIIDFCEEKLKHVEPKNEIHSKENLKNNVPVGHESTQSDTELESELIVESNDGNIESNDENWQKPNEEIVDSRISDSFGNISNQVDTAKINSSNSFKWVYRIIGLAALAILAYWKFGMNPTQANEGIKTEFVSDCACSKIDGNWAVIDSKNNLLTEAKYKSCALGLGDNANIYLEDRNNKEYIFSTENKTLNNK